MCAGWYIVFYEFGYLCFAPVRSIAEGEHQLFQFRKVWKMARLIDRASFLEWYNG